MAGFISGLGLRTKLVVAFVSIALVVVATGAVGAYGVLETQDHATDVADDGDIRFAVTLVGAGFEQQYNAVRAFQLDEEDAGEEFDEGGEKISRGIAILEKSSLSAEQQELYDQLQLYHNRFDHLFSEFTRVRAASEIVNEGGMNEDVQMIATEIGQLEDQIEATVTEFATLAEDDANEAVGDIDDAVRQGLLLLGGVSVGALGVAVVLGLALGRHVGTPIQRTAATAETIAAGDLDTTVERTDRGDEVGALQNSFAELQTYLQTVAAQAEALADQEFDVAVLSEEVPGDIGDAIATMQTDMESFVSQLEQSRAEAKQAQAEAEALAEELEQQATVMGETMAEAADGDLTQRLDEDLDNESMAAIAQSFNEMVSDLEATVVELRTVAERVDDRSTSASTSVSEIDNASAEVSEAVQTIANGATEQDENIRAVTEEMTQLSASIQEVAFATDDAAATVQAAAELGDEGSDRAASAAEAMAKIEDRATETAAEIESLATEIEQIGEIVDLIDEIAAQTNMLALNASIEAARAGEAGEGFAVVAEEIKGLAEETAEATDEIEELITTVQSSAEGARTDIQQMSNTVADGTGTVEDAVDALEGIIDRVEQANDSLQSVAEATDDQAVSAEEAASMVDEVGEISRQTSTEADDAAAAAQQQAAAVTDVAADVQTLSDQSSKLREFTDKFDVTAPEAAGAAVEADRSSPAQSGADD